MRAWKVQHSKENNFMALQFRYVHTISTFILSLRQIKWISHLQVFTFLLSPLCHNWTYSTHQELHTWFMLCCGLLWFVVVHYQSILSKFFRVASLAVEWSYNSPNPVWKWVNNSYVLKNYHITLINKYNKQVQQNHLHIISDLLLFSLHDVDWFCPPWSYIWFDDKCKYSTPHIAHVYEVSISQPENLQYTECVSYVAINTGIPSHNASDINTLLPKAPFTNMV